MKLSSLVSVLLLCLSLCASAQDADMEHRKFKIGPINYFGYDGLDLEKVRAALPLHTNDEVTFATFPEDQLKRVIQEATDRPATDIAVVCCDSNQRLLIFIGLTGSTSHPLSSSPTPTSNTHLDAQGLQLYNRDMAALMEAMTHGVAAEDDSEGYAVSAYPEMKAVNLAMRNYALNREKELTTVLATAQDPKQRIAAAMLLGYAQRSPTQAQALSRALSDSNETVRNNATRALEVLASAPNEPLNIDAQPLIQMLYSGKWTDRNKSSLLLMRLTESSNPSLLRTLHQQAMKPLIEGASWIGDPGHSDPFLILLGRIAGIPKPTLDGMVKSKDVQGIVAAARAATL